MNYSKPEVRVLGEAAKVIQLMVKHRPNIQEGPPLATMNAAYDLDE